MISDDSDLMIDMMQACMPIEQELLCSGSSGAGNMIEDFSHLVFNIDLVPTYQPLRLQEQIT